MFGLEKKKNKPFEFDLEKELKKSKKRENEISSICDTKTQQLKNTLREGTATEIFDQCGILIQGYEALKKVVQRVANG